MNIVVRDRLREICPVQKLSEMDVIEVEKACNVAFKIIGYNPKNFEDAFQKTWETSDAEDLCDFVFEVWRNDK